MPRCTVRFPYLQPIRYCVVGVHTKYAYIYACTYTYICTRAPTYTCVRQIFTKYAGYVSQKSPRRVAVTLSLGDADCCSNIDTAHGIAFPFFSPSIDRSQTVHPGFRLRGHHGGSREEVRRERTSFRAKRFRQLFFQSPFGFPSHISAGSLMIYGKLSSPVTLVTHSSSSRPCLSPLPLE